MTINRSLHNSPFGGISELIPRCIITRNHITAPAIFVLMPKAGRFISIAVDTKFSDWIHFAELGLQIFRCFPFRHGRQGFPRACRCIRLRNGKLPAYGGNDSANSVALTYYNYNAPGALVTVTRTAGSSGRATVDYSTVDGTLVPIPTNDAPAIAGFDYQPVSGTLVFDDWEMSKTILIPIVYRGLTPIGSKQPGFWNHADQCAIGSARTRSRRRVSPRVDPGFNVALVKFERDSDRMART